MNKINKRTLLYAALLLAMLLALAGLAARLRAENANCEAPCRREGFRCRLPLPRELGARRGHGGRRR